MNLERDANVYYDVISVQVSVSVINEAANTNATILTNVDAHVTSPRRFPTKNHPDDEICYPILGILLAIPLEGTRNSCPVQGRLRGYEKKKPGCVVGVGGMRHKHALIEVHYFCSELCTSNKTPILITNSMAKLYQKQIRKQHKYDIRAVQG